MRLAVWHDPPRGGARRAFDELLVRLAQRHAIDVFQLTTGDGEGSASPPAYADRFWPVDYRPQRHRRRAPYWNDWQTLRDLKRLEQVERAVAAKIDGDGFDAVLTSVLRTSIAPALPRFVQSPCTYYCHEPPRRFYEPWCRPDAAPLTAYERARRLWRWPAQAYLDAWSTRADVASVRAVDRVATNSRYTAQRIEAVYARSAEVCYLGVDHTRFRPADTEPPRRVLSVGMLEPHKGFDFLIRAIGHVTRERRPALTIVGRPAHPRMPALLRKLASRLNVELDLVTDLSDDQLADAYRSHAVFVFAARYEPFGLVVLEALASGLPVVAVDEGGVRESVRHEQTGLLVERDAAAFGAAVEQLLASPEVAFAMGQAAREDAVANWSWDTAARRIELLLEERQLTKQRPATGLRRHE